MLRFAIAGLAVAGLLCAAAPASAQTQKSAARTPQAYQSGENFTLRETCLDGYSFVVLLNRKGEPVGVSQFMEYRGSAYPRRCGEGSRF